MIRTPDQRVRVFVSSTLGELAAEREAVNAAIRQLRLTPVPFEPGRGQPHRAGQQLGAGQALLPATHPLLRVRVPYDIPAKAGFLGPVRARSLRAPGTEENSGHGGWRA